MNGSLKSRGEISSLLFLFCLPNGGLRGIRVSSSGGGGSAPPFPQVVEAPAQIVGSANYQVRMELSQRLVMEGEGFQASLTLENLFADQSVDDIQINLIISDTTDAVVTNSFIITPPVPSLLGNLPAGQQVSGDWLILPTKEVTATEGETFLAQAEITYEIGGESQSFTTLPEEFTVLPAPELVITYELPEPTLVCHTFDLSATVRNVGVGPARNVSLSSSQPKVVENTSNSPQGFEIIGVSVNNQAQAELNLNVELGEIPPGQSQQIVWRIRANEAGRMIEFTSDYRVENYYNVPLAPRLRAITTTFATPQNPFLYGCLTGAFNITGDVKDEFGKPITDVVFLLGYGSDDTEIVATTIITPIMDATGAYTIPNLAPGTYTFAPIELEVLNSPLAFTESPLYTVIPAKLGAQQGTYTYEKCMAELTGRFSIRLDIAEYICSSFDPAYRRVNGTTETVAEQNFLGFGDPPEIPEDHHFKGAGWLRYVDGTDDTDYQGHEIGWNVETSGDILGIGPLAGQIAALSHPDVGVETIVRLDIPREEFGPIRLRRLPNDPPDLYQTNLNRLNELVATNNCEAEEIVDWQDRIDQQYTDVIRDVPNVRFFILGNEPNHTTDEWNYSAAQYAFVYNCYYQHWLDSNFEQGEERQPLHGLFVAGPGHEPGRPNQWDIFLPDLFNNLTDADGFTMHVYGYSIQECREEGTNRPRLDTDCGGDQNGNLLFKDWLNRIMTQMNTEPWVDRPLIITEYNPGAGVVDILHPPADPEDPDPPPNAGQPTGERVPYVNVPPRGWAEWFDRTLCWARSAQANYPNVQLSL